MIPGLKNLKITGRVETIQTTALLRSVKILKRVLAERRLAVNQTPVRLSANADVKNSQGIIIIIIDHTNKWYLHNPTSVLENDTHKLP